MVEEKCTNCLLCASACPLLSPKTPPPEIKECYGGYVHDEDIVLTSSSGGFFTVLAEAFLKQPDSHVAAVVWADDFRSVNHTLNTTRNIEKMKGSKYIQSRKNTIYKEIKTLLDNNHRVMFVGCPCETWALRNILSDDYDNLFCVDFICMGPTTEKVMSEYADKMEKRFKAKISYLNLRHVGGKVWIPQWMDMRFSNGKRYLKSYYSTPLGIAFYFMQRPSCYHCKFSGDNRKADLTLGDFHGADAKRDYYNPKGISVLIVNSNKGKQLMDSISDVPKQLSVISYEEISGPNPRTIRPWKPYKGSEKFWENYQKYGLFTAVRKTYSFRERVSLALPDGVNSAISKVKRKIKSI